jgi:hypothetical protein
VDEVNAKLTEFISNLNRHHLRPIVPPPSEVTYASITTLAKDGRATNMTLEAGSPSDFVRVLREYIANLDESVTCITKKQVFDDLRVTKDRREKTSVVKAVFEEMRPDVTDHFNGLKLLKCLHRLSATYHIVQVAGEVRSLPS